MKERIEQKIGKVREYLSNITEMAPECSEKYHSDFVYRGALLHYLYLMADSCISLAEMTIKEKGLRSPQSYQEAFDILGDGGVLDPAFAHSFSRIAGFRNFLAHDYETVDTEIICGEILQNLPDIICFIDSIAETT